MLPCSEASMPQKALQTPISILCSRFSATLPMLLDYKTTVDCWLREMSNNFSQAITISSPTVCFFCDSIIGHFSLKIGSISVTDEVPLIVTTSLPSGAGVASFSEAVRERDQPCIITGRPAVFARFGCWIGFEAAHIFPLAYGKYWNDCNHSRFITIPPSHESHGSINSLQNGTLLASRILESFPTSDVTINPDVRMGISPGLRG